MLSAGGVTVSKINKPLNTQEMKETKQIIVHRNLNHTMICAGWNGWWWWWWLTWLSPWGHFPTSIFYRQGFQSTVGKWYVRWSYNYSIIPWPFQMKCRVPESMSFEIRWKWVWAPISSFVMKIKWTVNVCKVYHCVADSKYSINGGFFSPT